MREVGASVIAPRGDGELVMSHELAAPRALVFELLTRPIFVKRWLGLSAGWTLVVCEDDLRAGGAWRYVWYSAGGAKVGLRGVHRAVVIPERIVTTVLPDSPAEGEVALLTLTLAERGGGTALGASFLYDSRGARDRALASMERAAPACLDELAALLALASDPAETREDA